MRSVMKHQFSQIPRANIPRSNFNRSHGHKTTFDAGWLIPFYVDEVLPGDTFNLSTTIFARLATPMSPIMDNMFMDTFYFFVPNRLLWDNWQRMNGEQDNPGDSTDYIVPVVESPANGWTTGSLEDHMGIPINVPCEVNAMWHRAYNLIWNEWFRDENLQESVIVNKDDGPDSHEDYKLLRRGKRHDYFTSCLPWPQKGPGVELPLGDTAPVIGNGMAIGFSDGTNFTGLGRHNISGAGALANWQSHYGLKAGQVVTPSGTSTTNIAIGLTDDPTKSGLVADLSMASAATINSFRLAFQLQRLYERDARGGTRYTEILRSHFGVISPDARLQRPEYLGGSSQRVVINPVAQTSSTDGVTPQGNLAAFGLVADSRGGFRKSFVEHGVIIGLVNVRADLTYQQGLDRMFSRRTRYDFYWPTLAHLGEQAVLSKEIYMDGTEADEEVFGYQERWAEYRYFPSRITGEFRSTSPEPLDVWHLSQKFGNRPQLNAEFIQDNPPIDRVVSAPSEPHFIMDSYLNLQCARPMPVYSVPGLIDHF